MRYRNWFNKNFPDDIGGAILYLNWSISFFETGKIKGAKANTMITAFQNINLHHMLLGGNIVDKEIIHHEYYQADHFQKTVDYAFKITTQNYIDWLREFSNTEEYQKPIQEFKFLNHLLKNDNSYDERVEILNKIRALEKSFE